MIRLAVAQIARLDPLPDAPGADGERGVIVYTASVAAFDGQVGPGGLRGVEGRRSSRSPCRWRATWRSFGIRVVTIAPGLFLTPLMAELPRGGAGVARGEHPVPEAAGQARRVRAARRAIVENTALNGEVIRLDGALRMAPR